MKFEEKRIQLKNGESAILRSPKIEDAAELIENMKVTCAETNFLGNYPEEYDKFTVEREEKWIQNHLESQNALCIVCEINGKIAGTCGLNFETSIKTAHRASFGLTIKCKFWNLGIGSAMLEEMIVASKTRGIKIMELVYLEGNDRGRRLYEKYGFKIVSERPNMYKLKDGTMLKEIYMQKYLDIN